MDHFYEMAFQQFNAYIQNPMILIEDIVC